MVQNNIFQNVLFCVSQNEVIYYTVKCAIMWLFNKIK